MRVFLYLLLIPLAIEQLWLLLLPLGFLYILYYRSYELIAIAALIDGYVGAFYEWPLYTITTAIFVIFIEWLRPRIMFYTR